MKTMRYLLIACVAFTGVAQAATPARNVAGASTGG